jgi:hypothetical protein
MTGVPRGPWLRSPGVAALGPLVALYHPDFHKKAVLPQGSSLLALVGVGCGIVAGIFVFVGVTVAYGPALADALGRLVQTWGWQAGVPALVLGGVVLWLLMRWVRWRSPLYRRLLVGHHGVLEWTPHGETVVLWRDLGSVWTPCEMPTHYPGTWDAVVFALLSTTGQRWYLPAFYERVEEVAEQLSGQLLRHNLGLPLRPPADERDPSLAPRPDRPWLTAGCAWRVAPLERVCTLAVPWSWRCELLWFLCLLLTFLWSVLFLVTASALLGLAGKRDLVEQSPWLMGLLILGAMLPKWLFELYQKYHFEWRAGAETEAKLLVGAGGVLVWVCLREYVLPWDELRDDATTVAAATAEERPHLLAAALLVQANKQGANLNRNSALTEPTWLVTRYLEEMRLRGAIPEGEHQTARLGSIREAGSDRIAGS